MCKLTMSSFNSPLTCTSRRTYGRDIGEDIREGYSPTEEAVIDQEDGAADPFSVGDDDDAPSPDDSEESRQWKEAREPAVLLKPKYGVDGEAFENVWDAGDSSEPPKENP